MDTYEACFPIEWIESSIREMHYSSNLWEQCYGIDFCLLSSIFLISNIFSFVMYDTARTISNITNILCDGERLPQFRTTVRTVLIKRYRRKRIFADWRLIGWLIRFIGWLIDWLMIHYYLFISSKNKQDFIRSFIALS